jgi:amino acid adenylation domain-containing protein
MLSDSQRAALAVRLRRDTAAAPAEIPRRPAGQTDLPLSYGQEQLWFIDGWAPGQGAYNIPVAVRLAGPLDPAALTAAAGKLVARHEALRTRLAAGPRGAVQVVDPPGPVPVEVLDFTGTGPEEQRTRLRAFLDGEAVRPFDLAQGPLLRLRLVRLGPAEHVLLAVVHHTVFDGWSVGVLVRELAALYRAELTGGPAGLAVLPVQFADYALWERERLRGPVLEGLAGYWRETLAGFETLQFPADRPRPAIDSFEGALAVRTAGAGLLGGLRELSRREGTTLFVTLLAGLLALLHRYTGQSDLTVGTVSANRGRGELTQLIGFLVNTLPIRVQVPGDLPFTDLLGRVKQATVGAYAHQDLPFGKLVETLGVERDASRAPVFQIAFTHAERDHTPAEAGGVEFALTDLVVGVNAAKFDLTFTTEARAGGLWVECSYKTALFDPATVERLLGNYEVLLRGAAADPATPVSRLPLLTEAELHDELTRWNDTAAPPPTHCLHEAFAAQAARTPGAVAAQFEDQTVSYAELDRQSSQIAHRLRGLGVGPEVLAGVCMRTGLRRLAALLGIWKAGGGYVPLDPALPAGRLSFMIADTGMKVVLTDGASAGAVPPAGPVTVVPLDAEWEQLGQLPGTTPAGVGVTRDNVAYVLYTSGSTGQPKGVVVEHRQVANFVHGMTEQWQVGPADVSLQFASLSFDVSVLDMFVPLLSGARVVLAGAETLHSPPRLAALMREKKVTFASLPPAVLSLLSDEEFPGLRMLMAAGEELPSQLARRWLRPGLRFVNGYGPTETTVIATHAELTGRSPLPPPIGRPTWPNYQAYVLDQYLNPVPAGVVGELHVGGAGVARGYLNRPELTEQRFIPDPFRSAPGARLYKTGDLVRRRPDGTLVFVGRIDNQVKIRGLRVELGEIETALASHPAIAQAVAVVAADQAGEQQLAAYLRPVPGGPAVTAEELRDHLGRTLPGYMIPAYLITVAEFPLNTSGKIDRAALPPLTARPQAEHVPPATLIEVLMADMYASLLGTGQVGATDSFFDLGGNSLQAMRLISIIDNELEVDVGAAAVFLAPTPRQLAAVLRDKHDLEDVELGDGGIDELTREGEADVV